MYLFSPLARKIATNNRSLILYLKSYETIMNKNLTLGVMAAIALSVITAFAMEVHLSSATGARMKKATGKTVAAPIATSGDNTYIAWWTNETGNDEVMLRSSSDRGSTFGDKINLSNTSDIESQDVEVAAEGDNIVVTWWERSATSDEPVIKISTDNGQTFGPLLKLAANGTISSGKQTQ
jgi:hypothetical protein